MSEVDAFPRQIGKYRLDAILGRGAMGVVYRAFDPLIERTLALKTVQHRLGDADGAEELLRRFRTEAQAAGRLMHPNIVAVHEYGEANDLAYIAMEFVDGRPLSEMCGVEACSLPQVLAWMRDLLAALAYSHAHGVVHRDIKPANLLVTRDGRIKVGDFGIARIESSTLTQTGAMLGTPSYMSPEQFRGEAIDSRSDLFSAGVVLYQLLTGQRPFSGSTAAVMQQVLTHSPAPPSRLNPLLPGALDAVVMRALAKTAQARFADAAAFLQALETAGAAAAPDADATVLLSAPPALPTTAAEPSRHGLTADLTAWKLAVLPQLEALLTAQIGPVARLLLRRIAVDAPDFSTLGERLLEQIPSPAARADFATSLAALERELESTPESGADGPVQAPQETGNIAPAPLDPAFGSALAHLLALEIGPIAAIVVKRALPRAADRPALVDLVAGQIEAPVARARFLDAARALADAP
ncbi:serine/threonine-protein kinase [Massilia sp. CFBP9012]|uniref:serine/threonine-protein kinase n=1 Tax=Massilia sp. CFBP9012 TaxID=3096531 RepID=UPI002A6B48AE|nr:serine/threonine-protein kinase [Massilia sp. CFBP9012]MDY0974781.1 serine/threonine-protein kinase [Massilia sp. CFBP9012]